MKKTFALVAAMLVSPATAADTKQIKAGQGPAFSQCVVSSLEASGLDKKYLKTSSLRRGFTITLSDLFVKSEKATWSANAPEVDRQFLIHARLSPKEATFLVQAWPANAGQNNKPALSASGYKLIVKKDFRQNGFPKISLPFGLTAEFTPADQKSYVEAYAYWYRVAQKLAGCVPQVRMAMPLAPHAPPQLQPNNSHSAPR